MAYPTGIAQPMAHRFEAARWSWHDAAACRGMAPEIFFPARDDDALPAKAVCARCSVRAHCLADALARGERYGVWGGLAEKDRENTRVAERPRHRSA
jgi:hypothetical protein